MKMLLPLFSLCFFSLAMMAQQPETPDHSFVLSEDTLWFITPDDFVEGKSYQIVNPHNYPIDLVWFDQWGAPFGPFVPWFSSPYYPGGSFPMTLPAGGTITNLVHFAVSDQSLTNWVYDTLYVRSVSDSAWLIIAADSTDLLIGMKEAARYCVKIFPNPFSETVNISWNVPPEGQIAFNLFDISMKEIVSFVKYTDEVRNQPLTINLMAMTEKQLAPGYYLLQIRTESGVTIHPLFKE
jgi:hypothetical protein